eukprot:TRINITY_DN17716_c0_g1_i1.p1 TRINITY_DN17716_c0_g1~~TRINITY_DN17716_c0_g1_i1.p1  ORF type:complete len:330 (+),score=60.19 TRINITY_DN17716_c0_g1_i1:89-1078(+)
MGNCGTSGKKPPPAAAQKSSHVPTSGGAPLTRQPSGGAGQSAGADHGNRATPDEEIRRSWHLSGAAYQRFSQWLVCVNDPPNACFGANWMEVDQLDPALDGELKALAEKYTAADSLTPELAQRVHKDYEANRTSALFGAEDVCRAVRRWFGRVITRGTEQERVYKCEEVLAAYWRDYNPVGYAKRCLDCCREISESQSGGAHRTTTPNIRLPHDVFLKGDPTMRQVMEAALINLRNGGTTRSDDALSPEGASRSTSQRGSDGRPYAVASSGRREGDVFSTGDTGADANDPQLWSNGAYNGSPRYRKDVSEDPMPGSPAPGLDDSLPIQG